VTKYGVSRERQLRYFVLEYVT